MEKKKKYIANIKGNIILEGSNIDFINELTKTFKNIKVKEFKLG